jgi:hypothetical protein
VKRRSSVIWVMAKGLPEVRPSMPIAR